MNQNKTPNCDMREALVSHMYNEATPEESSRVVAHLKQCNACADELTAFERVRGMLQQWQVEELPEMYIMTKEKTAKSRSALSVLKELFTITPLWGKALGGLAAAMLLLAVMGTSVNIGRDGASIKVSMFGAGTLAPPSNNPDNIEQVRAEVRTLVSSLIAASEQQQREALKLELVNLELGLQNAHEADLAKLTVRIQQQRELLKSLERDLDRREGLALSDLLFSEATARSGGDQGSD